MSKVDAMRAMREARYAASARTPKASARPSPAKKTADSIADPKPAAAAAAPAAPEEQESAEALCGHRSMNGRNCRRPAGHAEKNHRYN